MKEFYPIQVVAVIDAATGAGKAVIASARLELFFEMAASKSCKNE